MKQLVKNAFLIIASVVLSVIGYAQIPNEIFSKLSVEQGLSSVTVTSITKDSRGYIWIGTVDGLNRYNGYNFRIYRNDVQKSTGLLRNYILAVKEDSNGTLWVSTAGGGLYYYDRDKDRFNLMKPYHVATINVISEDSSKRVWFGGNALYSLDLKTNQWKDHTQDFPSIWKSSVLDIEQENPDEMWVITGVNLYRWNVKTNSFKEYRHTNDNNSISINYFYDILKDKRGNLWIGTRGGGLDQLNVTSGKFTHYTANGSRETGPLVNVVRTLCLDGDNIWVGTENGGLSKLDVGTGKFSHYFYEKEFPKGISDNSIWSLYKDNEGRLWVGTFSFGLSVLDRFENKFLTLKIPLENTTVNSILKDSKGRLWIGTEGGVVQVIGNKTKQYLGESSDKSTSGIPILTIYEDFNKSIWLGTWNEGLFRFNEHKDLFESFAKGGDGKKDLSNPNNYSILQTTNSDELLIASYNGLNVLGDDFENNGFHKVSDSIGNYIRVLFQDRSGKIWVGSRTEIRHYHPAMRTFTPVFYGRNDPDVNIRAAVTAMYQDTKGRIWIGTDDGLYEVENMTMRRRYIRKPNGLANQDIRGILEDDNGNLWVSTSVGISFINPEKQLVKNYDASDGLFANGFKYNAAFKDQEGNMYFGGSDGVVMFHPSAIIDNPYPPSVLLEELRILNEPVTVDGADSILHKQISETTEVTLPYNANFVALDFVALNYSASGKNQYAYKLDGIDAGWNEVGKSRTATYTNLDPGKYNFYVKASNNDGVWSEGEEKLVITILPPWWLTKIAYSLYGILVILLLYFFRKVTLMRAHFVHDIKMERLKLENAEKLNRAKLDFFTNISHEFRTPLTIIMGLIESLTDSHGTTDNIVRTKLQAANRNASRLLRLVNELLDFRKAESGTMKLKLSEVNIVSFLQEVKLSFEPLADEKNISFSFHASDENIKVWVDLDQFEKVVVNLLSNAFKHTGMGGEIGIWVRANQHNVSVIVQDNGKGIKAQYLENIFQTFFSYEEKGTTTGTGIGLALSKSIVELHHGKIEVDSVPDKLTRFTITLLNGKSHFSENNTVFVEEEASTTLLQIPIENELILSEIVSSGEKNEKKLLVVEDNEEVRALIASIFAKEYSILQATDGLQGMEVALAEVPDVIISDVMMPRRDGIAFCKELKANINTSHIPVILLTARTSVVFQLEGLETGADDYITKPFNGKLLQLKVRNLMKLRERVQNLFADNSVLTVEPHAVAVTSRDQVFIEKALKSVEDNMSNLEYSVEDLCKDVGMSKTSLFRKLKALTGQSANEFIRTIRLKRAAQLLPQHQLTIAEIAYSVGFSDPKYFRLCFKKQFKMSPSEFSNREETIDQTSS